MKYTFEFDPYRIEETYKPGDEVLVYSTENLNTGREYYNISKRAAKDGLPGNLDASQKRFHGWRGTTNNISIYAHGVYRVKEVEEKDDIIKVKLDRTDLRKDAE